MWFKLGMAIGKQASTALVRRMAKGMLSPQTVQRAAGAMEPGKFRFVENMGRGQFSLADRVVGNIGGQAGEAVRKLPTRFVPSPESEYGPVSTFINRMNGKYTVPGYDPPMASYLSVGPQGGFQNMANGFVPKVPRGLMQRLSDTHSGNVGPRGQIFDFSNVMGDSTGSVTPLQWERQLIAPAAGARDYGRDLLGNVDVERGLSEGERIRRRALLPHSNNMIRRFWSLSPFDQAEEQMRRAPTAEQMNDMRQHLQQFMSPPRRPIGTTVSLSTV